MKRQSRTAKAQCTQRNARKLDRKKTMELHAKGLSSKEIAQHQGVSLSTVWRFLYQTEPERQQLARFKENRADCLANIHGKALDVQGLVLDQMKADLQDKAIANALSPTAKTQYLNAAGMAGGISFDKERLERGESTSNISLISKMVDATVLSLYKRKSGAVPSKTAEPVDAKEPPHEG